MIRKSIIAAGVLTVVGATVFADDAKVETFTFTESKRDIPQSRMQASASTSRPLAACAPKNAIDGKAETSWSSDMYAIRKKGPQWIMLEFDAVYDVDALRCFKQNPPPREGREDINWIGRIQDYEVQVSTDGQEFTTVASGTWDKKDYNEQRVAFDSVKAKFVRIICKKAYWDMASISEIMIESPTPTVDLNSKDKAKTSATQASSYDNIKMQDTPKEEVGELPPATTRDIPKSRMKASASSYRPYPQFVADSAIDGKSNTSWLSNPGGLKKNPEYITVEFDQPYKVDALRYFKQADPKKKRYHNWIGSIQRYEVSVSIDGKTFKKVASGEWDKNEFKEQRVSFPATEAKFIRLTAFSADRDLIVLTELSIESPQPPEDLAPVKKKAVTSSSSTQDPTKMEIMHQDDLPEVGLATARDIPKNRMKASASSSRPYNHCKAPFAIDGNATTGWSSKTNSLKTEGPQWIQLELDQAYPIDALRWFKASWPDRPRYANWIGSIGQYEVSVSMDGKEFKKVASGKFEIKNLEERRVKFPENEAKFIRLTAISAERDSVVISELAVESPEAPKTVGIKVPPVKHKNSFFAQRHSAEAVKELSQQLAKTVNLNTPEMKKVYELNMAGKYKEALAAFNEAAWTRMKLLTQVCKIWKEFEEISFMTVQYSVDGPREMLDNIVTLNGEKYDIGDPGSIDWKSSVLPEQSRTVVRIPVTTFAKELLVAFEKTGDAAFLNKWADFSDAQLINDELLKNTNSFNQRCGEDQRMFRYILPLLLLGKGEKAHPGSLRHLPLTTLPRLFTKLVPLQNSLFAAYFHANAQNWTFHGASDQLLAAFLIDYLFYSNTSLAQRALRILQTYGTKSKMPDGTEAEQAMWYNWGYAPAVVNFLLMSDILKELDPDFTPISDAEYKQLEDSMLSRTRYSSNMYTQRAEWPLFLRGDNRKGWGLFTLAKANAEHKYPVSHRGSPWGRYVIPLMNDPVVSSVLKTIGPDKIKGYTPTYTSNYFPWGGYRIIRENWKPDGQYGVMFSSPKPGKYWARGEQDNNSFGLSAYGVDLIGDNTKGHYGGGGSAMMVDGHNQNYRAGYPAWGHKQILLNGWKEPDHSRFLSSDTFEFMEGTYRGTYGNTACTPETIKNVEDSITDVTHQRQVIFVRDAKLWILTDKLMGDKPHDYTWRWNLPYTPDKAEFFSFLRSEINIDEKAKKVSTAKPDGVNLTMQAFTNADLSYKRIERNKPIDYEYYGKKLNPWNNVLELLISTKNQKELLTVTAIYPRADIEDQFKQLEAVTTNTTEGFTAEMPNGTKVRYLAAKNSETVLNLDNIKAQAGVLLVTEQNGVKNVLTLDCKELSINGKNAVLKHGDIAFTVTLDKPTDFKPIYRPLRTVDILPQQSVFVDQQEISFRTPDQGVELRYTLDGSEPNRESELYKKPFTISQSTTIKTRSFRTGEKEADDELNFLTASPVSTAIIRKEAPLPAQKVAGLKDGIHAVYYEGEWGEIMFNTALGTQKREGPVKELMDISLRDGTGVFAFDYSGYINIPTTGIYKFHTSDEFMENKIDIGYDMGLKIDGKLWKLSALRHAFGIWSVALEKGLHKIELCYVDYRGNEVSLDLRWAKGNMHKIKIDHNRKGDGPPNIPGMKGNYVWSGGVPELLISGPGVDKQPIPSTWLKHL